MISRTQVAARVAEDILNGAARADAVASAAAWLKGRGRERQVTYLVQDVIYELAKRGYVFAHITTAHELSAKTKQQIEAYVADISGSGRVECAYKVDARLIGGVVIDTPMGTLDESVKLRLMQIVEGVSR